MSKVDVTEVCFVIHLRIKNTLAKETVVYRLWMKHYVFSITSKNVIRHSEHYFLSRVLLVMP